MKRVAACALLLLPLGWIFAIGAEGPRRVVVVFASGVDAYNDAMEGIRSGLGPLAPEAAFIDVKSPHAAIDLAEALPPGSHRLVITVGGEALRELSSRATDAVVLPTMTLRPDAAAASSLPRAGAVLLDVPVANLLTEVKEIFPGKNRIALIRNPARNPAEPSLAGWAKQQGLALTAVDCSKAEDLVRLFLGLRGKTDFVIVLPDSSLYNNTTVSPLIVASLENQLPLVAFSSSFVRAGAAVGIYPDFHDIGAQTAGMAVRYCATQAALPEEGPRKLTVAVNQRVARLLGLEFKQPKSGGLVVFK